MISKLQNSKIKTRKCPNQKKIDLRMFCEKLFLWFTISSESLCFPLGFLSIFEIYDARLYIVEKLGGLEQLPDDVRLIPNLSL